MGNFLSRETQSGTRVAVWLLLLGLAYVAATAAVIWIADTQYFKKESTVEIGSST
jgi:hypothetical protein